MATQILMPALSPTMEEGKLAKWLVKEGDEDHSGDILAEIETDKATMEFEAVDEGRIGKILIPEGTEGVKVNQPIAVLVAEGEKTGAANVDIASMMQSIKQAVSQETAGSARLQTRIAQSESGARENGSGSARPYTSTPGRPIRLNQPESVPCRPLPRPAGSFPQVRA